MVLKNCEDIKCILDDDLQVAPNITQTEDKLYSHLGLRQEREERYEKNQNSYQSPCFSFTSEIAASTFPTLEGKNKYSLVRSPPTV